MGYKLALEAGKSHEEALVVANEKSRDKSRTPMQWNSHANVGFSEGKPWITVPEDAYKVTVEDQINDPESMLSFYKKLLKLRKKHSSLQLGDYEFLRNEDGMIYFVRTEALEKILVVLNFTDQPKTLDVAANMKLLLSNKRTRLDSEKVVTILANEAMILKGEIGNDLLRKGNVKTCEQLLEEYTSKAQPTNPEKIVFAGIGENDVYNISAPFEDEGELVIAGRVESRDSEHSRRILLCREKRRVGTKRKCTSPRIAGSFFTRESQES